jgi:hypothetical protein
MNTLYLAILRKNLLLKRKKEHKTIKYYLRKKKIKINKKKYDS